MSAVRIEDIIRGRIIDHLTGDWDRDGPLIKAVCSQLKEIESTRPEFWKSLGIAVSLINSKDKTRFDSTLMSFNGPDEKTTKLLEQRLSGWCAEPETFWNYSTVPGGAISDPQAAIVSCYHQAKHPDTWSCLVQRTACIVLMDYRKATGFKSTDDTAYNLCHGMQLYETTVEARQTIDAMIHDGSRYKNLERHLGVGITFLLGTSLGESCWTKLLPQDGPKFELVKLRLRSLGLDEQSKRYRQLRIAVVNWFLHRLNVAIAVDQIPNSATK